MLRNQQSRYWFQMHFPNISPVKYFMCHVRKLKHYFKLATWSTSLGRNLLGTINFVKVDFFLFFSYFWRSDSKYKRKEVTKLSFDSNRTATGSMLSFCHIRCSILKINYPIHSRSVAIDYPNRRSGPSWLDECGQMELQFVFVFKVLHWKLNI